MSEVMTQAIIGMPFDMAMGDELSRLQFHGRAQAFLAEYSRLEQECERLRKQVNMLVKQHMPLEPIDGLDGWSEVISATKAIELRDAALNLLAKCQEKLDPHRDAVLWGEVCDAFKVKS